MTLAERPITRVMTLLLIGMAAIAMTWQQTKPVAAELPALKLENIAPIPVLSRQVVSIRRGDTLETLLARNSVDADSKAGMIDAIKKEFDVRKFRAGANVALLRSEQGQLQAVEYLIDADHQLEISKSDNGYVARVAEVPSTVRSEAVCGTLRGSLFESIAKTGEQPELAMRMAEVFAWDIDFYRDPQEGDSFCLLVEKKQYQNGAAPTYGRVLAAKYDNAGTLYDAFLFHDQDGDHYYSGEGQSLQAAFLRSPLKFDARISSHFSHSRLHPVLGVYREHLGTDYAAPTGTPVQAVADGRVLFSGDSGDSGNLITLQHANGFVTQYLHLSKRLAVKGDRVRQGERIGLVGATGLATGPHVDIRIQKNGRYMNWETLKIPRQSRIDKTQRAQFNATRDRLAGLMASGEGSGTELAARAATASSAR
jgi:murein DD-endopeptidase MepM/ murein hydrolase activator NlpD